MIVRTFPLHTTLSSHDHESPGTGVVAMGLVGRAGLVGRTELMGPN
jgi:hypothetical protein